jgi:hypothetical protein
MLPPTVEEHPLRTGSRLVLALLVATCVCLATSLALVSSVVLARLSGEAATPPVATAVTVSVFGDAAAPRDPGPSPSFTAALAAASDAPVGVFSDDVVPVTPVDPDQRSVELGLRFAPKTDGTVSALRFYRTADNTGPHVGTLWGPDGEVLARATFDDTASPDGWQTVALEPAVPVHAGVLYTASYVAPSGRYAADEYWFTQATETAELTVPAHAGVYAYGAGGFPTQVYGDSNYFVDVTFQPTPAAREPSTPSPEPSTPSTPSPEPSTPGPEPTGPAPEPTAPNPGPSAPAPDPRPTPTAGGVFGAEVAPSTPVDPDRRSVELGMRFVPKVDGAVTALRFYRTAANTGPHTGTLWRVGGPALATARFPDEGTGWQTAELDRPVAVAPGSMYVVSYVAAAGRYSADEHYFDVGIENAWFSVPPGAGVYAHGEGAYPTENFRNSNYYVDVRFAPTSAQPTPTSSPSPSGSPSPSPTSTATPQPTATPAPTLAPTPAPTSTPSPRPTAGTVLGLPTEAWWGGPAYYGQWSKATRAGWTDPSFFPIAVFFGKPSHASSLAAIGINTYMGAEHDGSPMSSITSKGISVLAQSEWTAAEVGDDPRVVGWHISDECDMGYSGCTEDWSRDNGEQGRLEVQRGYAASFRALNDGRFLQANFGNGVLGTWWAPTTMDDHVGLVDATSVDKYAYTSPHVGDLLRDSSFWPDGRDPASAGAYGWQQDRMESFMSPAASKPNWVFVETAKPFLTEDGARRITGDQIEGAVWNAIIHGAAGIAYFQHNNDPACGMYSLVECGEALRRSVADVNASVRAMAPVINSPSYAWSFGAGLETALKAHDGAAYILAMTDGGTGARSFTLPAGMTGTVEVVGEGRTLRIENGSFTDSFASEQDHHIYRVALR